MPIVSVIMPTYNYDKYIAESIQSVLDQTCQDFEIIIVDDGSTDNTKTIIESFVRKYPNKIRYFYQDNKGPAAARNFGIINSSSEYIAFQDADDIWLPTKLAEQLALIESNKEIALVFTDAIKMSNKHILYNAYLKENKYSLNTYNDDVFLKLAKINFIFTISVILRRNILNKVGMFNEKYRIGEDYDLWLRITKYYTTGFIDKPLVVINSHASNTTHDRKRWCQNCIIILSNILKSNLSKNEKKAIIGQLKMWFYELGYNYYSERKYTQSIRWFAKSIFSKNGFRAFFILRQHYFHTSLLTS